MALVSSFNFLRTLSLGRALVRPVRGLCSETINKGILDRVEQIDANSAPALLRSWNFRASAAALERLHERFDSDENPHLRAALFLADSHRGTNFDSPKVTTILSSLPSVADVCLVVQSMPPPGNPEVADAACTVLLDALQSCGSDDWGFVQAAFCKSFYWLPESGKKLALERWQSRLMELSVHNFSAAILPQLRGEEFRAACLAVQELLLSFPPVDTCIAMHNLLLQRVCAADLLKPCLAYCIRNLDSIPAENMYSALDTIIRISGFAGIALSLEQVENVMDGVFTVAEQDLQDSLSITLCWAMAVNNAFIPQLFHRVMSSVTRAEYGPNSIPFSMARQAWQYYQNNRCSLPGVAVPESLATFFQYHAKRVRIRKEEEAVMEVLRNMFPNACDVRKVGAVGGVIKQDIYQATQSAETPEDPQPRDIDLKSVKEVVYVITPHISRYCYVFSENGTAVLSPYLRLMLSNLEKLEPCRILVIPFEEFAQRRSKEELQEIIQELHDGKRPPDFTSSDGTPVIFNSDQLQYIPIEAETMVK